MDPIYIIGHKKPDTDAVVSAIALAYLKQQLNINCEARILGNINTETKFVLNYFKVPEPRYLNDVKLQIKDINYYKGYYLKITDSLYDAYQYMLKKEITGLPLVKDNQQFCGLITIKNILSEIMRDNNTIVTSLANLQKVLQAKNITTTKKDILANKLLLEVSLSNISPDCIKEKDQMIIIDKYNTTNIETWPKKTKVILFTSNQKITDEIKNYAAKNNIYLLKTPYSLDKVIKLLPMVNNLEILLKKARMIKLDQTDYVDDFIECINRYHHTNYPVLNKNNECLGLLRNININDKIPKKVILVDHNDQKQSVDGILEAEIVEVIDHHNIGNLTTPYPMNFRNMLVGSTSTIIYQLFMENNISIPYKIAGLLLSGILSDTLILKSPTTTNQDREASLNLAKIVNLDINNYGLKMLKAGSSIKNKTIEQIIYNDFKIFTINNKTIAIGQIFTMNHKEILSRINEYITSLNQIAISNNYYFVALFVTDIIKNGSYILYSDKALDILQQSFSLSKIHEGYYLDNIISRKKQIIPPLMNVMDRR